MKTSVLLVTATLTVAILLVASLVIAAGTRGENRNAVIGEMRTQHTPPSLRGATGSGLWSAR